MSNDQLISYEDFCTFFLKKKSFKSINSPFCLITVHQTYVSVTRNYIGPQFLLSYGIKKHTTHGDPKQKVPYQLRNKRILQLGMSCQWETFITLTFSPDNYPSDNMTDDWSNYQHFQKCFRQFTRALKWRYPDVKYLGVLEHGKRRGRVHYHILTTIPYNSPIFRHNLTEKRQVCDLWQFGYSDVQKVQNDNCNAVFYLLKYIEKGDANRTPIGKREVFASKGLAKTTTLIVKENELDKYLYNCQYYDTYHSTQIYIKKSDYTSKVKIKTTPNPYSRPIKPDEYGQLKLIDL